MAETKNNRGWICALVAVTFVILAITGPLMLLHLPLNLKALHIVMGVVFVVAGVVHLALNWNSFTAHFKNRSAIIAGAAAVVIAIALMFVGPGEGGERHRYGPGGGEPGIEETGVVE